MSKQQASIALAQQARDDKQSKHSEDGDSSLMSIEVSKNLLQLPTVHSGTISQLDKKESRRCDVTFNNHSNASKQFMQEFAYAVKPSQYSVSKESLASKVDTIFDVEAVVMRRETFQEFIQNRTRLNNFTKTIETGRTTRTKLSKKEIGNLESTVGGYGPTDLDFGEYSFETMKTLVPAKADTVAQSSVFKNPFIGQSRSHKEVKDLMTSIEVRHIVDIINDSEKQE